MLGGIFETIGTLGTQAAAVLPASRPVDMQPKPIVGAVVGPAVAAPTQGEQVQLAQGLLLLFSTSRAVAPGAAPQLALAVAAVCGPSSALTPEQQGQAVNQILSSNKGVDPAAVPTLYGIISMFIASQPVAQRRDATRHQGRKVIGESIFGNYLFANDALPQVVHQPWAVPTEPTADHAEPVRPAGMSGFGADVAVDHAIPTGMKWLGHGIMGGRTRHGGYATSRYGEPVTGLGRSRRGRFEGMGAAYDSVAKPVFDGCTMNLTNGRTTWPSQWACNQANFNTAYSANLARVPAEIPNIGTQRSNYANLHLVEFFKDLMAGKIPVPDGFPSLMSAPPPTVSPVIVKSDPSPILQDGPPEGPSLQPNVHLDAELTKGTGGNKAIAIGVGVLALVGIGVLLMGKKKGAAKAA